VVFQDVDYNLLSFEEQIKVDLQTDVMVGPHGAGLLHNIFMRDRAVLVELSVDGSGGLRHFHNLAHWYGRRYVNLTPSNPVRVEALYKELAQIIAAIDISKY
jgi:capsular polysaccharide biosynthesis protein